MNQNYSHSLAPKYSILLDPSGRMNIQQTILTVTTTINSNKVQIKTLIQSERKLYRSEKIFFSPQVSILSVILTLLKLLYLDMQVGFPTSQPFDTSLCGRSLIYYRECILCPFYPLPLSPIVRGCVWMASPLTIASLSSIRSRHCSHQMMPVRSNLAHHHHNCLLHCPQDTCARA